MTLRKVLVGSLAILLSLAPIRAEPKEGLDRLYDGATLESWGSRYERGLRRNFNTVIRPLLEEAGLGNLATVRIELPPAVPELEPFAYYASSPPATVTLSVTSLKFFDDLTTAIAWLERNGHSSQAAYDYISLLKYRSAEELGGRYPPPLEALRVPADALADENVAYIAQRIFDSAIAFVFLHELGHIAHNHPGYGPSVTRAEARANEEEADRFALEMMRRTASDPSGMVFLFMAFVHGLDNRGDFAGDAEYEAFLRESTHPVTSERVAAIAEWLSRHRDDFVTSDGRNTTEPEEIQYLSEQLASIARLMSDPEWQQATAFAGRRATLESLAIGRSDDAADSQSLAALPPFHGTYEGEIGLPDGSLPIRTVLRRSGAHVTGTYYYGAGEGQVVQGLVEDDSLIFLWREGNLEGYGLFESTDGGMSFAGTWGIWDSHDNGGSWSGRRIAE